MSVTSADALCPLDTFDIADPLCQSLYARAGCEEQMSKTSPSEDRGPSLASRDNKQNQYETSNAAIENTPENQV